MSRKRTPEQGEEPGQENATATVAQEPAAETNGSGRSFAEAVGKKTFKPQPDPFGIASDYQAGIHLRETRKYREMQLAFDEKPSQPVIEKLKENDYRWNPQEKLWTHPVKQESAMATRIDAERLFQELTIMIKQEKGIESGQGISG